MRHQARPHRSWQRRELGKLIAAAVPAAIVIYAVAISAWILLGAAS